MGDRQLSFTPSLKAVLARALAIEATGVFENFTGACSQLRSELPTEKSTIDRCCTSFYSEVASGRRDRRQLSKGKQTQSAPDPTLVSRDLDHESALRRSNR